jgi:prepilin-type N-terminal cleavage/methylation domain-containing protein
MRDQVLRKAAQRVISAEDGFTLIELLTTMAIGFIVLGALFTIQTVTLHQTTRLFSKVDATQHVRVAMEQVENELHSACVTDKVTPVQTGSTNSNLIFVSQYGTAAAVTPVEHQVTFNSAAATLTDATYAETGVTQAPDGSPVYTFANTPTTTRTLLKNVSQTGSTPIFQYFKYQTPMNGSNPYKDASGNPYMMLLDGTSAVPGTSTIPTPSPLTVPLSANDAASTAEVMISLTGGPQGGTGENTNLSDGSDPVADAAVMRLTPAANHSGGGAVFLPCQ